MSLRRPTSWSIWVFWGCLLAVWLWLFVWPVTTRFTRLSTLVALAVTCIAVLASVWSRRWLRWALIVAIVGGLVFLILPGRNRTDLHALRAEYVRALLRYEGVHYVSGGENWRGLDASGLVRRALMDSALLHGVRTLDPAMVRGSIWLWWNDSSPKAITEWQRDLTEHIADAPSVNELDHRHILPGDLAVTSDHSHIIAYVGDRTWIHADPERGRTLRITAPAKDNPWLTKPVRLFRWRLLRR